MVSEVRSRIPTNRSLTVTARFLSRARQQAVLRYVAVHLKPCTKSKFLIRLEPCFAALCASKELARTTELGAAENAGVSGGLVGRAGTVRAFEEHAQNGLAPAP